MVRVKVFGVAIVSDAKEKGGRGAGNSFEIGGINRDQAAEAGEPDASLAVSGTGGGGDEAEVGGGEGLGIAEAFNEEG